ncbi:MAG: ATP-binding protein [Bacteroidales bacterium]|nr:ATP-binding protein [Bacteroidales bacterium]
MKIAIASGKGGTGKTTLSVNLAYYLSGKLGKKVVLADLDVEEPNSGLFLKGKLLKEQPEYRPVPVWQPDKCTFCGKCNSLCNFNAIASLPKTILVFKELCHSCYACSELCPEDALPMENLKMGISRVFSINQNFTFLEGVLDIGQESAVPLIKKIKELAENKINKDSLLLFDSPPGTSCPVIEATKDADLVILITEPTPFGFHDLRLAVKTMRELDKKILVVINRYGIGNKDIEKYCKKQNIEIAGKIPYSRKVAELYSKGLLLESCLEVQKELEKIAKQIYTNLNIY